jgi:hypothetical protein
MKKFLPAFLLCFCAVLLSGAAVKVDPAKAVIVVDPKGDSVVRFAAMELQRHLKLVTQKTIPLAAAKVPGKYAFVFEKPANVKLKPEEAVWEVTPSETRLYGDSDKAGFKLYPQRVLRTKRTGDLTAVYMFLEDQLNFFYLAPGPLGITYPETPVLELKTGRKSWDPGRLTQRSLRWDYGRFRSYSQKKPQEMPLFYQKKVKQDYLVRDIDTYRWLKQMRMGSSVTFNYGHAFTRWWHMYGKTNPEFFALHKGKRAPWGDPANIKMCPSSKALVKQVVENWKNAKVRRPYINVCENDWGRYCECKECRALDPPAEPGKKWDEHLTDRYIHFANEVLKLARKTDPNVVVTFYAYAAYRFPPKKTRVEPGIVIGFVPSMMNYKEVDKEYKEWRRMGATMMFQRPNDMHINTGLPMGIEEILFKHFQVGIQNGIIGTDYDSLHRFWETTGIADYILARGHMDPSRSFQHWFDEYCSAFGPAAPEVSAYFSYWRKEVFDKRLYPNRKTIAEKGRYGNFRRGLMWDLPKYYSEKDFDITDAMLKKALARKNLTPQQKARLERLLKSNEHGRLTLRSISLSGDGKIAAAKKLHKFRMDNWDKLNMSWFNLFQIESEFGDVAGIRLAESLADYADGRALPLYWFFTPDPKKVGEKEKWQNASVREMYYTWEKIGITSGWENQSGIHPAMKKFLAKYDGIGYYGIGIKIPKEWKGKKVSLIFGAVDESAWVYVNGKLCGSHVYKLPDDWQTPFTIPIEQAIDWNAPEQTLVVKVEDNGGQGGIWRPVMLVVK